MPEQREASARGGPGDPGNPLDRREGRPLRGPTAAPEGTLALLSGEPAGRISTRNAGAVFFEATLSWRPGDEIPPGPILHEPTPGARFYSLARSDLLESGAAGPTHHISCEIRALHAEPLAGALDAALRSVTAHAALAEAVLETRAIRLAAPKAPPAALVQKLARQLWEARFPVSFGRSWTPIPEGANVSVGVQGLEGDLEAFLLQHPASRAIPAIPARTPAGATFPG